MLQFLAGLSLGQTDLGQTNADPRTLVGLALHFQTSVGFAHDALSRFANPNLGHTCLQVGADGSRKLPQRLLPIVLARMADRLDTSFCA